jgi:TRAP-type C4-dicarboxylate transport system permease small subunit
MFLFYYLVPKTATPQSIIAAVICISICIFLCFFGYKYYRVATFFGGFGLFG